MSEHVPAHLGALQALLEEGQPFFFEGQERDRNAVHGRGLYYCLFTDGMKTQTLRQVTFVTVLGQKILHDTASGFLLEARICVAPHTYTKPGGGSVGCNPFYSN